MFAVIMGCISLPQQPALPPVQIAAATSCWSLVGWEKLGVG